MLPKLLGLLSKISKHLDRLEEWANKNIMTFSESKHCKSCPWATSAIELGTERLGEALQKGPESPFKLNMSCVFKVVEPDGAWGCLGKSGQINHSPQLRACEIAFYGRKTVVLVYCSAREWSTRGSMSSKGSAGCSGL